MLRSRMLPLAAGVVMAVAACGGDTTGPEPVDDPATATEADAGGGDTTVAESPTTQPAAETTTADATGRPRPARFASRIGGG